MMIISGREGIPARVLEMFLSNFGYGTELLRSKSARGQLHEANYQFRLRCLNSSRSEGRKLRGRLSNRLLALSRFRSGSGI